MKKLLFAIIIVAALSFVAVHAMHRVPHSRPSHGRAADAQPTNVRIGGASAPHGLGGGASSVAGSKTARTVDSGHQPGAKRQNDTDEWHEFSDVTLSAFASADEVDSYLSLLRVADTESSRRGRGRHRWNREEVVGDSDMAGMAAEAAPLLSMAMDASMPAAAKSFSGTNNQVANVDEADIVKTDGDFVYIVVGSNLTIVRARPSDKIEIISSIELPGRNPRELLLGTDVIGVVGDVSYVPEEQARTRLRSARHRRRNDDWSSDGGRHSALDIIDISSRERPALIKTVRFDGSYHRGRVLDGYAYIVALCSNQYTAPRYSDGEEGMEFPHDRLFRYNVPYYDRQWASVYAVELSKKSSVTSAVSVLVEQSEFTLYMSAEAVYLANTKHVDRHRLRSSVVDEYARERMPEEARSRLERMAALPDELLSETDKALIVSNRIQGFLESLDPTEAHQFQEEVDRRLARRIDALRGNGMFTVISKIKVKSGQLEAGLGCGIIEGKVLNQFSLDEHAGVLRVATNIARGFDLARQVQQSSNHIFTLDSKLAVVGHLGGIAPDESIYSSRFIGDRLYLVTYRQIDPFFVFDLSDPANIEQLGYLKIPGFSRYLHPYDHDTIIGIGRTGTWPDELKISLFDVADVSRPTELSNYTLPSAYDTFEFEHRAFLFSREKHLMVLPAALGQHPVNGALVLSVSRSGIVERGIINHLASPQQMRSSNYYGAHRPFVERSLYVDDVLFTKSPEYLVANSLDDLSVVTALALADPEYRVGKAYRRHRPANRSGNAHTNMPSDSVASSVHDLPASVGVAFAEPAVAVAPQPMAVRPRPMPEPAEIEE